METNENLEVQENEIVENVVEKTNEKIVEKNTVEEQNVQESTKSKDQLLKELSKEWGINAFNPEEVKNKFNELNQYQESLKTEEQKKEEAFNSLQEQYKDIEKQNNLLNAKIMSLELGIKADSFKDVFTLSQTDDYKNEDIKKSFEKILEKYPNFKEASSEQVKEREIKIGTQMNQIKSNTQLTDKELQDQWRKEIGLIR